MRKRWLWLLLPIGAFSLVWASAALGSYAYLQGMGYPNEFIFPWDQLWVALPWIIMDGWKGIGTLIVWEWVAVGFAAALLPWGFVASMLFRRVGGRKRQPDLWGSTGFATRREMERGGIKTKVKLF